MTILESEQTEDDSDYASCLAVTTEHQKDTETYENTRKRYQIQQAKAEADQHELEQQRTAHRAKIATLNTLKEQLVKDKNAATTTANSCKTLNNNRINLLDQAIEKIVAYLEDSVYKAKYGTSNLERTVPLGLAQKKKGTQPVLSDPSKIQRTHRSTGTTDYGIENFDKWDVTHPQTTSIVQMFQLMVNDANADNDACDREKTYSHTTAQNEIDTADATIASLNAEITSIGYQIGDINTPGTTMDLIAVAKAQVSLVNTRLTSLNQNFEARDKYCTWLTGNYKDRRTLRNGERDALNHAWAFLKQKTGSAKPIYEVKDAAAKPFGV